jgi:predicted nucleic acid-binding protein
MNLGQINSGELVVIDANILVYANQQKSKECVQLLNRCARGEVKAIVPMPMVAELMHTLMLIEARENGWINRPNPARVLSEKPELIQRLTNYEKQMRQFLGIGLRLESVVTVDLIEALSIQREFGLLTNDSLLVAIARRLNCDSIVTADSAFQKLKGFMVYAPEDLGAM